jgi:hypothetical protein
MTAHRWRWRRTLMVAVGSVLLLGGGGSWLAHTLRGDADLQTAANWAQVVSIVLPIAVPLFPVVLSWLRRPTPATVSSSEHVEQARRQLGILVARQWRQEIGIRQLDDPAPLSVRWQLTDRPVMDRPSNLTPAPTRGRRNARSRGRLVFDGRTDAIADMARSFTRLHRRRLVILGDPGTGKTTVAVLLLRQLLKDATPGAPVPVLFTLSGWDPDTRSFQSWLANQLTTTYPALNAEAYGPNAATALIDNGHILPILDGLDELPPSLRPAIVAGLNRDLTHDDPIILTCRTTEYQQTIDTPRGDVLTSAAVIEPQALTSRDITTYMRRCLPPQPSGEVPRAFRTVPN